MQKAFLLFLAAVALHAQHGYAPGDVQDGQRWFTLSCAVCHGPEGSAVPGVALGSGKFRRATTDEELVRIIQQGLPGTAMPPGNFDDFRAGTIVAYLRSMAQSGPAPAGIPGDAQRGKAIFHGKGNCASCHRIGSAGSRMGPDLTDIGSVRRAVQIERSLLEPDEEVLPQNRFLNITLKSGGKTDGRLLNQDAYTVQLLDSKERLVTLQRSAIKDLVFTAKSPMPSFRDRLSQQELADVVSYLVSLKGLEAK